ncbi:hypothetical protein CDL12_13951 [Handroanthus impetiginosus]|uniref:RING-type domain-containing protein n=1 Tax=Handroanthus impetiginosus TaxID=429701 RepID=A0A2G9H7D4_9LAMI|nr:hypothetical protein CDL12_13951 [Handroanthus impetiginosus]
MSQQTILKKLILVISSIRWALDFLLHKPLFQFETRREDYDEGSAGSEELCAVCLCRTDEEITRKLKCGHIFHSVCFERWAGYGHWTCPLCRNYELHEQVLVFNFCNARTRNNQNWWLR